MRPATVRTWCAMSSCAAMRSMVSRRGSGWGWRCLSGAGSRLGLARGAAPRKRDPRRDALPRLRRRGRPVTSLSARWRAWRLRVWRRGERT